MIWERLVDPGCWDRSSPVFIPGTLSRRREDAHTARFGSGLTPCRMRTYDLFHSARSRVQWSPKKRSVPALSSPVDKQIIRYVVERAATIRRNRYRDDEHYRHFTEGALTEHVCGVEGTPHDEGDGWWLVGRVVDLIAGEELEVVCRPGETIRVREIVEVEREKAPPLPLLPERPKGTPASSE